VATSVGAARFDSAPPRDGRAGSHATIVVLLAVSVFVNYIDRANLAIAAPLIQGELGLTPSQLGILLSAFFWTYAVCQLAAGWLVDRYHAPLVLAAGFAVWSLATSATGLVTGFAALLAARLILGMGESVAYPSYSKILAAHLPEPRRGIANAAISAGLSSGPAIGMFAGGLLVARLGWRAFFIGLGLAGLAWLLPWLRYMPRRPVAAAGDGDGTAESLGDILRQGSFWGTAAGLFASNYLNYFMLTWLPLYLVRERHLSMDRMAVVSGTYFAVAACASLLFGWLSDRVIAAGASPARVRVRLTAGGLVGMCAAMTGCALVPQTLTLPCLAAAAAAFGCAASNNWAVTQLLAGARTAGRWTGAQNFLGNLAGAVSPALAGFIVQRTGHFAGAFAMTALVAAVGATAWLALVAQDGPIEWRSPTRKAERGRRN